MIDLSVTIQAHEERRELAEHLAGVIGCDVTWDPEPHAEIRSPWRTYRRALEETPRGASHRLIVQDDVEVCPDFLEAARRAVSARPSHLVCFFVQGEPWTLAQHVNRACEAGEPFAPLPIDTWCPAVATCWPSSVIDAFLSWYDAQGWPSSLAADDEIIGRAVRGLHIPVVATVPNLVEHPDVHWPVRNSNRRPMGGKDASRVSACFIHPDDSALDIVWK